MQFTTQAEEVRDRRASLAQPKTVEPWPEPIHHEPAKKAPPLAQEAPKKGHSPAARDPAAERQSATRKNLRRHQLLGRQFARLMKHNPGPEKRVLRKTRLEDAKVHSARFCRGRREAKARTATPSGLVAPPEVRPPDERQSGTPKKGAAQDEALQQSLPAEIKFGMLDGNAVRFTSLEAWWLVDGVWRPISPDEVLLNAAVMREARYDQFFPEVPPLPSHAFKADNLKFDGPAALSRRATGALHGLMQFVATFDPSEVARLLVSGFPGEGPKLPRALS